MATAVTIQIKVDSTNSAQSIDAINKGLADVGIKGSASIQQAGAAMDKLGGHAASNLDGVRLLSQEFGLRLPRAMEAMLSRMPAVTSAISGVLGGLAGIAAIEVFAHIVEGAKHAYDEFINLNSIIEKYNENLEKARQADLPSSRTSETTAMRLRDQTQVAASSQAQAQALHAKGMQELMVSMMVGSKGGSDPFQGAADLYNAHKLAQTADRARVARDSLVPNNAEESHKAALAQIELNHAQDDGLNAMQKVNAELAKKIALNREDRNYANIQDKLHGNEVAPNAGAAEQAAKDVIAQREAAAQRTKLGIEQAKRVRDLDDEARKSYASASGAGLKGAPQIQAELQARMSAIQDEQNKFAAEQKRAGFGGLNANEVEHFLSMRVDAQTTANAKLKALDEDFTQYIMRMDDERADSSLGADGKIEASARQRIDELKQAYGKDYSSSDQNPEAAKAVQDQIAKINQEASAQKAQVAQRNAAEDLQYDRQAAEAERRVKSDGVTGWVSDYRAATAEIRAQQAELMQKLEDDEKNITGAEFERRKADLDRTANAQIAQQNQQMQHQIASTLQSAFTNPIDFIKGKMEQMFFDIVAAWIMRMKVFTDLFGTTMGGVASGGPGGSGGGAGGRIMGSILRGSAPWSHGSGAASTPPHTVNSDGDIIPQLDPNSPAFHLPSGVGSGFVTGGGFGGSSTSAGTAGSGGGSTPTFPGGSSSTNSSIAAMAGNAKLGYAGAAMGGYMAYRSTTDAFKSGNALKGAMGDAAAGAAIGGIFGPMGAGIGAAIGGVFGGAAGLVGRLSGESGNLAARDYYRKTLFPEIEQERNAMGGGNFQTAISQINKTASDGMLYMQQHYGSSAAQWVNANYLKKEQTLALSEIESRARGGGEYVQMSAAQFHSGGNITGFGSLATSTNEGYIHAMLGETVMNPSAAASHGAVLTAMNGGASAADVAAMYLAQSARPSSSGASSSGGDTHFHVHTLDTKTMEGWLRGGGARLITKHTNGFNSQYAGDGISG